MRTARILICLSVLVVLTAPRLAEAIDFFFEPDTAVGEIGNVIQFSGRIGESELMRGYTVYMAYDTNRIDLYDAPLAGSLVANQEGLEFNYFDHPPFEPGVLEIGATVFGTDFWQGPGELFTMRMSLRTCGDEPIVAPFAPFFVAADGTYPAVAFHPALVRICDPVPQAANALTIRHVTDPAQVMLRWFPVTMDTLGRPLFQAPMYLVVGQQIQPSLDPPLTIAVVPDTFYADPLETGIEYIYTVVTQSQDW